MNSVFFAETRRKPVHGGLGTSIHAGDGLSKEHRIHVSSVLYGCIEGIALGFTESAIPVHKMENKK